MGPDEHDEANLDDSDSSADPGGSTARSGLDAVGAVNGRRAFLGTLIAAAAGAGIAGNRVVDHRRPAHGSSDADDATIVYGIARADPDDPRSVEPREKTVPDDWVQELEAAVEVHRGLPISELSGFVGSFVVPGDFSDPAASISIQTTADRLRDEVAGLSLDVDVSVDVFEDLPDPTGETGPLRPTVTADLADRSVPGGVFCGNDEMRGSLAPALYDPSSEERFFTTANHLYGGSGTDHRGDQLFLYDEASDWAEIGRVRRGFEEADVLVADPADGRVPSSEIADASPRTVGGQFTMAGLAELKARGEPLEMTGAISGHSAGEIHGIDAVTFYTGEGVRTGQLLWGGETTFTDGDSGSVNYHVDPQDDDRILIGGMNSARTWWPGADFTWGTAAYAIRDAHGFVF